MFSSFVCEYSTWSVVMSVLYVFYNFVALGQVEAERQRIKVYITPNIDHLRLITPEIRDKINTKDFVLRFLYT